MLPGSERNRKLACVKMLWCVDGSTYIVVTISLGLCPASTSVVHAVAGML